MNTISECATGKKVSEEDTQKILKSGSVDLCRVMKELICVAGFTDTSYKELLNIIMFTTWKVMNDNYSEKPEHLFYINKNIQDVAYYVVRYTQEKGYRLEDVSLRTKTTDKGIEVEVFKKNNGVKNEIES